MGSAGGVVAEIVHDDPTVASEYRNAVYYYHYNHRGDVIAVSDESGNLVFMADYDAYGKITRLDDGEFTPRYTYSTKRYFSDFDLYYFGFRWYMPALGRWMQADPAGYMGGSLNQYRFCANNSPMRIDRYGLCEEDSSSQEYGPPWPPQDDDDGDDDDGKPWWRKLAAGIAVHGSWVNPLTSRGGGVIGFNRMSFLSNNETTDFTFGTAGRGNFGFDVGVAAESVWAIGSGPWAGDFNGFAVAGGILSASVFWSPGSGGWVGVSFGIGAGTLGGAYEETTYYETEDQPYK
jgi:RHS repeat-associated protein